MLKKACRSGSLQRNSDTEQWVVLSSDLRAQGIRSPQGFSFNFHKSGGNGNFFWTTNKFAAYQFYKQVGSTDHNIISDFKEQEAREVYLHKLSYEIESTKDFISPKGLDYRPYQKAGIEYCLETDNTLVADQQRTGKTIVTIGVINNSDIKKVLIVCPKTAKLGWLSELKKWLVEPRKIQVLNAQSTLDETADIYIANYDILHIITDLQKINFDLLVPDECHLVCRLEARRTKFFMSLSGKKIIALSGTPLLNNPKDLLSIAKWLDPFWKSFRYYRQQYVTESGISLTLDEVQDRLRSTLMLRRLQSQVFTNEPPDVRIVPLEADAQSKPLIEMELHGLQDYVAVRRKLGLQKVKHALNYINTYTSEGEKLVVFAYHNAVIERLAASLGSKATIIYGPSTEREREESKLRFNTDPNCQILLGSIGAASMALNLSVSNHLVFVECDWSNGMMEQAKERCSDMFQQKHITIEYLVFEGSLDERILTRVGEKDVVADRGLDLIY